ncbi:MAG: RNA polymerase sigma factor [Saprospiraceae bacterium]|nr:RNA polymerase sigma factor [Saprospiraceae bacterium]
MTIEEYNHCVRLHSDGVFRFIFKNLAQRSDTEDVVQTTFEKLWIKREMVSYDKAKSYLFSIAYHTMIDLIRKQKFVAAYQNIPEKGDEQLERQFEAKELMDKSLAHLSPIQKSLILLRDYEGYDYEEIAKISELSLSQVKVYLFRARKKLQETIQSLEKAI